MSSSSEAIKPGMTNFYDPDCEVGDDSELWARGLAHLFQEYEECILVVQLLADKKSNRNPCLDTDVVLFVEGLAFE